MELLVTLIKNMSVIIVLAYVLTRSRIFISILDGNLDLKNKLYLIVIFGLFSIYGTLSGTEILGGIANIRDLGPMIAGLMGGPVIGLGSGLIGAAHRYSLGGLTALPCAISTIIAGLAGGVIFLLRRGQLPGVALASIFAALMEIFHMGLVLLLVRPYNAALDLVKQISLPMLLANSLGMGIFIFIVLNLIKERATEADKRLMEGELRVAREIQLSIVPKIFPAFPNRSEFDIHAILEPAKEVGGDLYDYFLLNDNTLCFLIGDVSGKGVPASLFMAVTKTLLKTRAHEEQTPAQILNIVNKELCIDNDSGMFVTVFLGFLHIPSGRVTCSNAGHNLPYILKKDGTLEKLPKIEGIALGVFEDFPFNSYDFTLQKGDTLLLYTDGINEAMNSANEQFGDNRMEAVIKKNIETSVKKMTMELNNEVRAYAGKAEQSDDITIMALKYVNPECLATESADEPEKPENMKTN
ncbi:PP2C family protein-serine/threonine phosphatase [Candidatus Contubernalis alkaliaceticus]|uniref:PP2C family protein-serine/threonine phosphatase n=1 Tax=Candidatus Contubernalis alkaliaceticus TaxID=338645 RepID=UPI001F4BCE62|nr:SpoIIE family protein phosphatase [Candidatus Contubernalis alkalaceticus]UNC92584.1 SpoIIE family protein phosphatase [Candidatus Contubernalis alkalaceticus]